MRVIILSTLVGLSFGYSVQLNRDRSSECPEGWVNLANSCYLFLDQGSYSWTDANATCNSYFSNLVEIETQEEQDFLVDVATNQLNSSSNGFWIGISGADAGFDNWVASGNEVNYTSWCPNEPNQSGGYSYLWTKKGLCWDDTKNTNNCESAICEITLPDEDASCTLVPECLPGWKEFNGSCYLFVNATLSWTDADALCLAELASLVEIETQEEQDFLVETAVNGTDFTANGYWIGINGKDVGYDNWAASNEGIDFTSWCPNEPNGTGGYSYLWTRKGYCWDDTYNNNKCEALICERPPGPLPELV